MGGAERVPSALAAVSSPGIGNQPVLLCSIIRPIPMASDLVGEAL